MSPISIPVTPSVTIFVRHSESCPHNDDYFYKKCRCRKHLRWRHNGKQMTASAKTRSWSEAEKAKRAVEDEFGKGHTSESVQVEAESRVTLLEAKERFLQSKRHSEEVGDDTWKKYDREIERLIIFLANRQKHFPNEITTDDVKVFQTGWLSRYPSKQTRRRVLTRYRAFLRYCIDSDWLEKMPKFDKIPKDTSVDLPTLPLSAEEYATLLDEIPLTFKDSRKATRIRALVRVMRYSGLAIRDAVTLERTELIHDVKRKLYRVVTNRQKTGTHVSVPLPVDVSKELLAVPNENKQYFFWNTGTGKPQSAVTNWQHDLRELFRAAGFPEGHPHQLRDTFAVDLLEKGVPIEEVSKALGHDSIKTTEKYYAKWVKGRQDRLDEHVIGAWD